MYSGHNSAIFSYKVKEELWVFLVLQIQFLFF